MTLTRGSLVAHFWYNAVCLSNPLRHFGCEQNRTWLGPPPCSATLSSSIRAQTSGGSVSSLSLVVNDGQSDRAGHEVALCDYYRSHSPAPLGILLACAIGIRAKNSLQVTRIVRDGGTRPVSGTKAFKIPVFQSDIGSIVVIMRDITGTHSVQTIIVTVELPFVITLWSRHSIIREFSL